MQGDSDYEALLREAEKRLRDVRDLGAQDPAAAAKLLEEALDATRRAQQERLRQTKVGRRPRSEVDAERASLREVTIGALDAHEVPTAPKDVAEVAFARFNKRIEPRRLAGLRRDERRAWSNPRTSRPTYIVPALDAVYLAPHRGLLTLSTWDLRRRIITPLSPRVDHLNATRNLARLLEWLAGADESAGRHLERVVRRRAASIPGALTPGKGLEIAQVVGAAEAELRLLEPDDANARDGAAERALSQLDDETRVWGSPFPGLAEAK